MLDAHRAYSAEIDGGPLHVPQRRPGLQVTPPVLTKVALLMALGNGPCCLLCADCTMLSGVESRLVYTLRASCNTKAHL